MREQHLDLFAFPARPFIKLCADQRADDIPGLFEDAPRDFSDRLFRTATALQRAWRAIELAGPVENLIVADDRSARGQRLGRRTNVDVPRFVEPEVGSRECPIGTPGFVPDRDVGCDPLGLDQPIQRGGRTVGAVGGQPFGFEPGPDPSGVRACAIKSRRLNNFQAVQNMPKPICAGLGVL